MPVRVNPSVGRDMGNMLMVDGFHGFDGMVNPCVGRNRFAQMGTSVPNPFRRDDESLCGA